MGKVTEYRRARINCESFFCCRKSPLTCAKLSSLAV